MYSNVDYTSKGKMFVEITKSNEKKTFDGIRDDIQAIRVEPKKSEEDTKNTTKPMVFNNTIFFGNGF